MEDSTNILFQMDCVNVLLQMADSTSVLFQMDSANILFQTYFD